MSGNICKFDRESICATCLSQDRKLFSVSDVKEYTNFYLELSLTGADRFCWECHRMVQKIIAFKNKAQKALEWLRDASKSRPSEVPCLSSLDLSTGIFLNVTNPGLTSSDTTPPPIFVSVKQEVINEDENIGSSDQTKVDSRNIGSSECLLRNSKLETRTPQTTQKLGDRLSDANIRISRFEVRGSTSDRAKVASSDRHRVENDRDTDIVKDKEEFEIVEPSVETGRPKKRKAPSPIVQNQTDIYTEERLSEEGLLEWWQKKKTMEYYTQTIPLERCDKCMQPLNCPVLVRVHPMKHTDLYGDFECDICTQRMIDERELEFHKKLHYRILKCRYCEFVWDDVNAMRQHCSEMHGIKQTLWECEQCMKQIPSRSKFSSHIRNHRRARCTECSKSLCEANLKTHMIQHRGGKPLVACAECGGGYRGEEGLKAHMRTHGTEVDPAAYCKECNVQFRHMMLYRTHMKSNKHAAESDFRYKCKECNVKFVSGSRLRSHMDIHKDTAYPCDQCDKAYRSVSARKRHVKNNHEGLVVPRNKLCDYCGRGFTSKNLLSSHINTHTGARPFVCKLCGADFGHKSALYLHGRYKHKIQKKKSGGKDRSGKDNSVKDISGNDSSVKDNSGNDSSVKDISGNDSSVNNISVKDNSGNDRSVNNISVKDNSGNDRSVNNISVKDNSGKENMDT